MIFHVIYIFFLFHSSKRALNYVCRLIMFVFLFACMRLNACTSLVFYFFPFTFFFIFLFSSFVFIFNAVDGNTIEQYSINFFFFTSFLSLLLHYDDDTLKKEQKKYIFLYRKNTDKPIKMNDNRTNSNRSTKIHIIFVLLDHQIGIN